MHYYNENDDYAAQWIENLILDGQIPDGKVDRRSIVDVRPGDLVGFTQCHFFAGIAGWALAARIAGWPDGRELWTGSCPCQPFSAAGKQAGFDDERHLWPEFLRLIRARRPNVVMGEQVASALGREWLDRVWDDMEDAGYGFRPVVLPACGVGAPHKRERSWFVGSLGHTATSRPQGQSQRLLGPSNKGHSAWFPYDTIECLDGKHRRVEPGTFPLGDGLPARVGRLRAYGNAIVPQVAAEVIAAYMDCAP